MQEHSANEITPVCPDGFDYRQLRLYVRSRDEDIPPAMLEHIEECPVCVVKWDFLQRTDPIVRAQYESRAHALAEQLHVLEKIFSRRPEPEQELEHARPAVSQIEALLQASLRASPQIPAPAKSISGDPKIDRILIAPMEPREIVQFVNVARATPDGEERQLNAKAINALFSNRITCRQNQGKVKQEKLIAFLCEVRDAHKQVEADETSLEMAASFRETVLSPVPILTMVGNQAMFDAPEFRRQNALGR